MADDITWEPVDDIEWKPTLAGIILARRKNPPPNANPPGPSAPSLGQALQPGAEILQNIGQAGSNVLDPLLNARSYVDELMAPQESTDPRARLGEIVDRAAGMAGHVLSLPMETGSPVTKPVGGAAKQAVKALGGTEDQQAKAAQWAEQAILMIGMAGQTAEHAQNMPPPSVKQIQPLADKAAELTVKEIQARMGEAKKSPGPSYETPRVGLTEPIPGEEVPAEPIGSIKWTPVEEAPRKSPGPSYATPKLGLTDEIPGEEVPPEPIKMWDYQKGVPASGPAIPRKEGIVALRLDDGTVISDANVETHAELIKKHEPLGGVIQSTGFVNRETGAYRQSPYADAIRPTATPEPPRKQGYIALEKRDGSILSDPNVSNHGELADKMIEQGQLKGYEDVKTTGFVNEKFENYRTGDDLTVAADEASKRTDLTPDERFKQAYDQMKETTGTEYRPGTVETPAPEPSAPVDTSGPDWKPAIMRPADQKIWYSKTGNTHGQSIIEASKEDPALIKALETGKGETPVFGRVNEKTGQFVPSEDQGRLNLQPKTKAQLREEAKVRIAEKALGARLGEQDNLTVKDPGSGVTLHRLSEYLKNTLGNKANPYLKQIADLKHDKGVVRTNLWINEEMKPPSASDLQNIVNALREGNYVDEGIAPRVVAAPKEPVENPAPTYEEIQNAALESPLGARGLAVQPTSGGIQGKVSDWINKSLARKNIAGPHGQHFLGKTLPAVAQAARKMVAAPERANLLLTVHKDAVIDAAGHDPGTPAAETFWNKFKQYMTESQLMGRKDLYRDLRAEVKAASSKDLLTRFDDTLDWISNEIKGRGSVSADLTREARKAAKAGNAAELRKVLLAGFRNAETSVGTTGMTPAEFGAAHGSADIQGAVAKWKALVEPQTRAALAEGGGKPTQYLGPADAYFPLISEARGASGKGFFERMAMRKQIVPSAKFRTGLDDAYVYSDRQLAEHLAGTFAKASKNALIEQVKTSSAGIELAPNEPSVREMDWGGKKVKAVTLPAGDPKLVLKDGKYVRIQPPRLVMPKQIYSELRRVLENDVGDAETEIARQIVNYTTEAQLWGPLDTSFHASKIVGQVSTGITTVPFDNPVARILSNTPLTKAPAVLTKIIQSPELKMNPDTLQAMADNAEINPSWIKKSEPLIKPPGPEAPLGAKGAPFKRFLYGREGLDIRARYVMHEALRAVKPDATPQEYWEFVSQLGNYHYQLKSVLGRAASKTGFSPFYEAGTTGIRSGMQSLYGGGPVLNKPTQMMEKALGAGIPGALITWALGHKALYDKWPWHDPDAKLLAYPIPDEWRDHPVIKAMWPDQKRKAYFSMSSVLPFGFTIAERGLRASGIRGAAETLMRGGNIGQAIEHGVTDVVNTRIQPWAGPAIQAALGVGLGLRPAVGKRESGKLNYNLTPIEFGDRAKAKTFAEAFQKRLMSSVMNMFQYAGFYDDANRGVDEDTSIPERLLYTGVKAASDVFNPRGVTYDTPENKAKSIEKERKRIEK